MPESVAIALSADGRTLTLPDGWALVGPDGETVPVQPPEPVARHWRTVERYFTTDVPAFEGGFQDDPDDDGNYVNMPDGTRRLIGTNRGVTPGAYAEWKGIDPTSVTVRDMLAITAEDALQIGVNVFYRQPGFDKLPWSPPVEILVDWAWGSGPSHPSREVQDIIGVRVDGIIGPNTAAAFQAWLTRLGLVDATLKIGAARLAHWDRISVSGVKYKYRTGWLRRARHTNPYNPDWWGFEAPPDPFTEPREWTDYQMVPFAPWHARWPNFSPEEIGGKRQAPQDKSILVHPASLDALQALRNEWAEPIFINSGYRSASYNTLVGGASNSFHMKGMAFDCAMPRGRQDAFIAMARKHGFRGIGHYSTFIHIDTRESPAEWWG